MSRGQRPSGARRSLGLRETACAAVVAENRLVAAYDQDRDGVEAEGGVSGDAVGGEDEDYIFGYTEEDLRNAL